MVLLEHKVLQECVENKVNEASMVYQDYEDHQDLPGHKETKVVVIIVNHRQTSQYRKILPKIAIKSCKIINQLNRKSRDIVI
ncbi:unnamed protein product [Onchocerca flexuosa]|uniref:Ovule protein n=1 Tax=Onchocerca flexuosa TaxID=387005 RepID=A0A183HHZ8_9BILA|nr:unnamed protein product [Onchocerca flexuosa]